jgi:hypothetical protein
MLALLTTLSAQATFAVSRGDDGAGGWRGVLQHVKQLIVKALEDGRLSFPPG